MTFFRHSRNAMRTHIDEYLMRLDCKLCSVNISKCLQLYRIEELDSQFTSDLRAFRESHWTGSCTWDRRRTLSLHVNYHLVTEWRRWSDQGLQMQMSGFRWQFQCS